jgi:hypothetical protein
MDARIGFLPQPLLGELIQMGPAVEGAIADEEVVLDVADVALVFALGLGSCRPTRPRPEAIVSGQIEKPRMEDVAAAARMGDDRALLVIDEDLPRDAAEPLEGADERLVGVLGIFGVRRPEMNSKS